MPHRIAPLRSAQRHVPAVRRMTLALITLVSLTAAACSGSNASGSQGGPDTSGTATTAAASASPLATATSALTLSRTGWFYKVTRSANGFQFCESGRMDFSAQSGSALTGTLYPLGGQASLSGTLSGHNVTLSSGTVTFKTSVPLTDQWSFTGTVNDTVTAMDGSATRFETDHRLGRSRTDIFVWTATRPQQQLC